jgi:hypothetical protein
MSPNCPLARSEGLITEELDGELLVYDSESNMAHALDPEAAALWRACDGNSDTQALATRCNSSDEHVRMTLARLGELGLLKDNQADQEGDTRRSALRKIGIAGVGVATISSVLVPASAASGSCVQPGGPCLLPGQTCCAGFPSGSPNCLGNLQACCVPAGSCATGVRDQPTPTFSCCSGTGVPDSSCPTLIEPTGFRCTCQPAGACVFRPPPAGFSPGFTCCSGAATPDNSCASFGFAYRCT